MFVSSALVANYQVVRAELTSFENRRKNEIKNQETKRFEAWKQESSKYFDSKENQRKIEHEYFRSGFIKLKKKVLLHSNIFIKYLLYDLLMNQKGLYYKDKDDEDPDDELLHRHQRNTHLKEV